MVEESAVILISIHLPPPVMIRAPRRSHWSSHRGPASRQCGSVEMAGRPMPGRNSPAYFVGPQRPTLPVSMPNRPSSLRTVSLIFLRQIRFLL